MIAGNSLTAICNLKLMLSSFSLTQTILLQELWNESRLIFFVVVVIPMLVLSLVVYMLCCVTWSDEEGDGGEGDDSDEDLPEEPQIDKGGFETGWVWDVVGDSTRMVQSVVSLR